mmetsp:Transcript_80331/g.167303  ORF Transcript_80331/g.167303 Transcript_80331/m.167303 type:complete len:247 (-) Transcript_80331:303-1043(-)
MSIGRELVPPRPEGLRNCCDVASNWLAVHVLRALDRAANRSGRVFRRLDDEILPPRILSGGILMSEEFAADAVEWKCVRGFEHGPLCVLFVAELSKEFGADLVHLRPPLSVRVPSQTLEVLAAVSESDDRSLEFLAASMPSDGSIQFGAFLFLECEPPSSVLLIVFFRVDFTENFLLLRFLLLAVVQAVPPGPSIRWVWAAPGTIHAVHPPSCEGPLKDQRAGCRRGESTSTKAERCRKQRRGPRS